MIDTRKSNMLDLKPNKIHHIGLIKLRKITSTIKYAGKEIKLKLYKKKTGL